MASQSSKKIAVSNAKTLKELHLVTLIINFLSIIAIFILKRPSSSKSYIILSIPAFFCQYTLEQSGRPTYSIDSSSNKPKLIRCGDDLKGEGLFEYMFDCIYITWLIDILMIILGTNYVWWIYLIVPGYCAYKASAFIKSFLGGSGNTSKSSEKESKNDSKSTKSKRQTKLEARRDKGQVQFKRG